jgi:hypothetical protein
VLHDGLGTAGQGQRLRGGAAGERPLLLLLLPPPPLPPGMVDASLGPTFPGMLCCAQGRPFIHCACMHVRAQGNFVEELADFLIKTYSIPRQYFLIKKT